MQIEMSIKGLMVDPITNTPIVILRDKDGHRVLPIWVGIFEANAIALQIENVATPRPMTHDLLRNVIQDLKAATRWPSTRVRATPLPSRCERGRRFSWRIA
jgi:bifunctional DNase/RNase